MSSKIDMLKLNIASDFQQKEESYWQEKLSGELAKCVLPYDYYGNKKRRIETIRFSITGEPYKKIVDVCNDSPSLIHVLLMAVMSLLIFKYTGSEDITLGTPILKQESTGNFINTVLTIRNRLTGSATFRELLVQVRQSMIEATENQNYPIEKLLYKLNIPFADDEEIVSLFDIVVMLESIHERSYIEQLQPNVLLNLRQEGQQLTASLEYNASLYNQSTIDRLIDNFKFLLDEALTDMNRKIADIEFLSSRERQRLVYDINNTAADYPGEKTIHRLFADQVTRTPDQVAVEIQGHGVTFKELNEKSNRMTTVLTTKGTTGHALVGLILLRSLDAVTAILGVLKAGAAYLPIDPDYPQPRKEFIIDDSNIRLLLVQRGWCESGEESRFGEHFPYLEKIIVDDERTFSPGTAAPRDTGNPGDLAYVMYTSGTTGNPKGTLVHHQGVVNYLCWAAHEYVKNEHLDFCLYTSLSFDLTVTSLFLPLTTGNKMVVYEDVRDDLLINRIVEDNRVDIIKVTPAHLKIVREMKITHSRIRKIIVGGEELETELARDIFDMFFRKVEIYNEYGPTEAVVGCMIYRFDSENDRGRSVPIGVPVDNVQIYVLDRFNRPVPTGVNGEIYISGDGVARGYLNNQELTAGKFLANPFFPGKRWYQTGDLGRWLPNGNAEFLGRMDRQVKIRGFRIEPGEIECQLRRFDGVHDAVIVAREKEGREKYLCAYIVCDRQFGGDKGDFPDLRNLLSKSLPDFMIPSYFVPLEKIPLTPNGKLDYQALPAPQRPKLRLESGLVAPRNEIEEKVAGIWKEVLEMEEVGIYDNFFDLGGNSLEIIKVNNKLKDAFKVDIPVVTMFEYSTISSFVQYLRDEKRDEDTADQETEEAVQMREEAVFQIFGSENQ